MSIWCDGTDLYLYRGDTATLQFSGLPACLGYRVYFSAKSTKTKEIIFECAADPEYYYIDNNGDEIFKREDETEYEFIQRMERAVEAGDAIKKGRCKIFISSDKTEKLWLLKTQQTNDYYYGLKICFASTGVENTIIPKTTVDEETGEIIFEEPPKIIVRPKYVEGIMPLEDFDNVEIAGQDPKAYGLQPLLTPNTKYISIDKDNIISLSDTMAEEMDAMVDSVKKIEKKIPEEASEENQLADKEYVDEKIDETVKKAVVFKGILDDQTMLPTSGNVNGDMYWIREFVPVVPPGMHEGHSGTAIYNAALEKFEFEEDAELVPDNKTIVSNDQTISVQLSEQANNDLEIKNDGLYLTTLPLENKIDAEIERATGAEATLQDNIDAEVSRASDAERDLNDKIEAEATTRESEDTILDGKIEAVSQNLTQEISDRQSADATIEYSLAQEVERATDAEGTLTTNLEEEVTRATGAESSLAYDLAQEIERATDAEQSLGTNKQNTLSTGTGISITNDTVSLDAALSDLKNVQLTSLQNNDLLMYNATLGKWTNVHFTEIDGGDAGNNNTLDGGNSATTAFDEVMNGGDSSGN